MQRNPPCVTSHDFDHHYAAVRFGRGVKAVDRIRGYVQCRVKAEGHFRRGEVIVNGLGHSHDRDSQPSEIARNGQSAVAADGDDRVQPQFAHIITARK